MEFLHLLTHLAKLSLFSNIVLNDQQQQANYISLTVAGFSSPGYWSLKYSTAVS